jgi:uncharacterized protein (DUF2384 family)
MGSATHSPSSRAPTEAPATEAELWFYRKLVSRTVEAFGDELKASEWLSRHNKDFGDETPLAVAQRNGYDYRIIEPALIRIEHGIDY